MVGNVLVEGLAQVGYVFLFSDVLAEVALPDVLESAFPGNGQGDVGPPAQPESPFFAVDDNALRPSLVDSAGGVGVSDNTQSVAAAAVAPSTWSVDGLDERGGESVGFRVHGNAYCDPGGVRFSDRFSDRFAKTATLERMFV